MQPCNHSQIIFWEGFLLHGLWAKTGWSMEKVLMSTNFIKAIDQTFYGFTSVITHLGCWKRTQEKLVNHEPKGSWFTKLSFEWSYHRILSTDSKASSLMKLDPSIIHSGSESADHQQFNSICGADLSYLE